MSFWQQCSLIPQWRCLEKNVGKSYRDCRVWNQKVVVQLEMKPFSLNEYVSSKSKQPLSSSSQLQGLCMKYLLAMDTVALLTWEDHWKLSWDRLQIHDTFGKASWQESFKTTPFTLSLVVSQYNVSKFLTAYKTS